MMTVEQADSLFAATLTVNYDDDTAWNAISELRSNGNRSIYEKAAAWCRSEVPLKRARGAAVLCQLRSLKCTNTIGPDTSPERLFVDESYDIVSKLISSETDEQALSSELFALGHLYKEEAVALLVSHVKHPNEEIRYAVACALGSFPNNSAAVEYLSNLLPMKMTTCGIGPPLL